jgi:hypothetical protein
MVCVAASQAWNDKLSQENDAVPGGSFGLDRRSSPNDECGDYEPDNTGQCSPPMIKQDAGAYTHEEHEQNRQPPAE